MLEGLPAHQQHHATLGPELESHLYIRFLLIPAKTIAQYDLSRLSVYIWPVPLMPKQQAETGEILKRF